MSAEIVNLRRARKARSRTAKEKTAEQNRARFGMTRAERERLRNDEQRTKRHLDGLAREPATPVASPTNEDGNGLET